MSVTPPRYHMPTHLKVPDKIDLPLFGITVSLTMRQGMCFLCGWSMAWSVWQRSLGMSAQGIPGVLAHWVGPFLLAFVTYVIAVHELRGRYLERWAVVLLHYLTLPKVFVWHSVTSESTMTQASGPETPPTGETQLESADDLDNEENEEE